MMTCPHRLNASPAAYAQKNAPQEHWLLTVDMGVFVGRGIPDAPRGIG